MSVYLRLAIPPLVLLTACTAPRGQECDPPAEPECKLPNLEAGDSSELVEPAESAQPQFKDLFNGSDLSGWQAVNTAPSTWTVRDGLLRCSGKPTGELRTTRMFQNFILEVEWRHLVPGGNGGIFVWADALTAPGQPFHRSIEVQVLDHAYGNTHSHTTHGDIFPIHGAHMTPINGHGGSRAFPTELRSNPSPEWNHYRIHCQDGAISLAVNGKVVTRGEHCSPSKGYVCLESEGGQVDYRNLRIMELPDTPIAPENIARPDEGFRSLYSGVDLSGWVIDNEQRESWVVRDWVLHAAATRGPIHLSSERVFGDYDFSFDLRMGKDPFTVEIQPHGSRGGALTLNSQAPPLADWTVKGWKRIGGTLRGQHLSLSCNGRPLMSALLPQTPPSGPLRLTVSGPLDLANLFARTHPTVQTHE